MSRKKTARLYYLVGPSGAGKDTLIDYCRARLQPNDRVMIARRCITRLVTAGGEAHEQVSTSEFLRRRDSGRLALHWRGNNCHYGVGIEIDDWLCRGFHVLVNGSRAHLDRARARYGVCLFPIWVRVSPEILRQRLAARGRENAAQIEARIRRSQRLQMSEPDAAHTIDNNGTVATAGERLLAILCAEQQASGRPERSADQATCCRQEPVTKVSPS